MDEIQATFLDFLRFGVQQELSGGHVYTRHTQRGTCSCKCSFPNCPAIFMVKEHDDIYHIYNINTNHRHNEALNDHQHYSSPLYRMYVKYYFSKQRPPAYLQTNSFTDLNIPTNPIHLMYSRTKQAIKKMHRRADDISHYRISTDPYLSLEAFIESLKIQSPEDLAFYEELEEGIIAGYAAIETKAFVHDNIKCFHIDSTHQMIEGRTTLYALTAKTAQLSVFPFFYFIAKPETNLLLGKALEIYIAWAHINFEQIYFCCDCAKQIYTAIELFFPGSRVI